MKTSPPLADQARNPSGSETGRPSDEGRSACSPYPGGISAVSPGSRSAPRVHVRNENNPEGVEASAAFAPLPGCGIHHNAPFPGCVLRTTRGYPLPSLRDALTPEAWVRQRIGIFGSDPDALGRGRPHCDIRRQASDRRAGLRRTNPKPNPRGARTLHGYIFGWLPENVPANGVATLPDHGSSA
jgi:hypothetical protein